MRQYSSPGTTAPWNGGHHRHHGGSLTEDAAVVVALVGEMQVPVEVAGVPKRGRQEAEAVETGRVPTGDEIETVDGPQLVATRHRKALQ